MLVSFRVASNTLITPMSNWITVGAAVKPIRKRRKMSAGSRAKIAAAQRARWAKFRKSAKK